ncbi:hypothetical protein MLD38_002912 [Melastoma candidum]|uniref:Uncharacterized protein n=1 Tax=Melastoma candidum TaxID=119954 RepID=A0ACB9S104_9MYRT|nr:hypothetical protein MLD38_002912 [Melastoma candidum]
MDYRTEKFVRFQSYNSDKTSEGDYSAESALYPRKAGNVVNVVTEKFQRGMKFGSEKINHSLKSWRLFPVGDFLSFNFHSFLTLTRLVLQQVVILIIVPALRGSKTVNTKTLVKFVFFFQYIPRVVRIYPLYKEVTRSSGILTETAWAGAVFNLLLYMLAGHVFGAFWYLFSIEQEITCWGGACDQTTGCNHKSLYCDGGQNANNRFLDTFCPVQTPNTTLFNFGIFLNALDSGVVESTDFPQKFFFCFWWGLHNLSSLGQNLKTSTYVWEVCFAVFISTYGLVLFALLIGNMQTYLQSTTTRVEEMRVKRRDAEQWMSVPMFEKTDEQLLDALCDRLKPALYTEDSYVVCEGDPVDEMLFIMRGCLLTMKTNGGRTGFFNSVYLKVGDVCGEELLTWALDPHTSGNLPTSTRTVQALTEVEGFVLVADYLTFFASQFRRLHSKQLRHVFRFYSQQWRTWATCFIQVAWWRYRRKKLDDSLHEEENRLHDALVNGGGSSPSLGATIYASRFAANALRTLRQKGMRKKPRLPERLAPILLQKPPEPRKHSSGTLASPFEREDFFLLLDPFCSLNLYSIYYLACSNICHTRLSP